MIPMLRRIALNLLLLLTIGGFASACSSPPKADNPTPPPGFSRHCASEDEVLVAIVGDGQYSFHDKELVCAHIDSIYTTAPN